MLKESKYKINTLRLESTSQQDQFTMQYCQYFIIVSISKKILNTDTFSHQGLEPVYILKLVRKHVKIFLDAAFI